eukprot:gene3298-3781_t
MAEIVFDFIRRAGLPTLFMLSLCVFLLRLLYKVWSGPKGSKNPLSKEFLRKPDPLVLDKEKRDAILKEWQFWTLDWGWTKMGYQKGMREEGRNKGTAVGFTSRKIPDNLDAIVIGSGIGGLSVAALMSKAGKKVLVLEQHDQAGGCCHTFIEKGFEFDVGVHYIGHVTGQSASHVLLNQITDNQVVWVPLEETYDYVILGDLDKIPKKIPIVGTGPEGFKKKLLEHFPTQEKQLDAFMEEIKKAKKSMNGLILIKMMPSLIARFLIWSGLIHYVTDFFKYSRKTVNDVLDETVQDKDLRAVLAYNFGDYGTAPKNAPFFMQATLLMHFIYGGYYPRGGASEIAFHSIPVIQRSGGKVLVRAPVTKILIDAEGKAAGVRVHKGSEDYDIKAPIIISDAGIYNTYEKLLPDSMRKLPAIQKSLSHVKHGPGAMSIFIGLDATKEELGVKAQNFWVFSNNDLDQGLEDYVSLSAEKAGTEDIPLLFISFPSTKDPTWDQRFPGKTTCAIITLANYEWFGKWENARVNKRGNDYEEIKNRIAERAWQQACKLFPQIENHRVYFEVGSPVTNNYYIGASRGEIYGIDHDAGRYTPEAALSLKPETPVPGLFLTGQDILTCGISGGMYGGLLAASAALNRNCVFDLVKFTKEMKKEAKKWE